ncbi:MAG: GNAT family N-acetyltransferase [Anaerolineales bacterium]|nr:GNAT family N-acetyltransferase [Anaerolineales bacterium]
MDLSHYLHMQLRLEGKYPIGNDLLKQVEIVPDEDMPLMLFAQLSDNQMIAYYDETLLSEIHTELAKRIQGIVFPEIEPLLDVLKAQNILFEIGHYKTYIFPSQFADLSNINVICLHKHAPNVQAFGFDDFSDKIYAIEREGRIRAACVSTRENEFCGEAWVYTDPEFRNRGFAQMVASIWATNLISAGKVPFYSHKMENIASANLANRLGLDPIFEEIVISYGTV